MTTTMITCPAWCEVDHSAFGPGPGVRHRSAARLDHGPNSQVLIHVEQFDLGEGADDGAPAVFMDATAGSAGVAGWHEVTADQAEAIAEYLQAAAARLRQQTC